MGNRVFIITIVSLLLLGIFFIDTITPLGVAAWLLYFPLLFFLFRCGSRPHLILFLVITTLLIIAGFFFSPPGIDRCIGALNRIGFICILWAISLVYQRGRESALRLRNANKELKEHEESLYQAATRLSLAQEAGQVGVFDWDMTTNNVFWTPEMEAIFGLPEGVFENRYEGWAERVHPDDLPRLEALFAEWMHSDRVEEQWEYRFQHNGEERWIVARGRIFRDSGGKPVRMIGTNLDITERKRAEEALKLSEEKLQYAVKAAHVGIWDLNLADHTVWRSLEHDAIFGYCTLLQEWTYEMFLDHVLPEDRAEVDARFRRAIEERTEWNFECRIRRADGEIRWIWAQGIPLVDSRGTLVRLRGIIQDITERKEAEEGLSRHAALLNGINRILDAALSVKTEKDLGFVCLSVAEEVTVSKFGFIAEITPQGTLVDIGISNPGWAACEAMNPAGHRTFPGEFKAYGIYGRVVADGRGFYTNDPASHPDSIGVPQGHPPLKSFLGVPLIRGGDTIGMIAVANREGGYRDEELNALESLALPIVQAFSRKRAEEALKEREALLRETQRLSKVGGWELDVLSGKIAWTEEVYRIYGVSKDFNPSNIPADMSFYHPDSLPFLKEAFAKALEQGEPYDLELKFINAQGEHLWVRTMGNPVRDNGKVVKISGNIMDITEQKRMEEEIRHIAHHDSLTGLPNRLLFMDILRKELAHTHRSRKKLAVFFLDMDRFKYINDTLGHDVGDKLLRKVASRLRRSVREADTVSRIGGDEFNILLTDLTHAGDIITVAQNILHAFLVPCWINGHELHISISVGISIYPDDAPNIETLLKNADIALYHAKEQGGNSYQFYAPSMNRRTLERIRLEHSLRQALVRGELMVYYQPQLSIDSRQVVCAEALVRWEHPELGILDPIRFISLAEETGVITSIDEWVLREACAQFQQWQQEGHPELCVTVNLSAKQFKKADLVDQITRILDETGLAPCSLNLEITESIAMENLEHTIPSMHRLVGMGIGISIDDFGTGYSSLSYLKKLPVNKLKIDQSFVRDIATDADDRSIIKAVTALAQNMQLSVVAEGVETEEQLEFLRTVGCQEAQGYLFSRPLPPEEFKKLIADGK